MRIPVEAVLRLMNDEDRKVPEAVTEALPQIAAVDLLVQPHPPLRLNERQGE